MNWQEQAKAIWGEHWKLPLSRIAGVTKRTVQRWNAGHTQIPAAIIKKIDATYRIWVEE